MASRRPVPARETRKEQAARAAKLALAPLLLSPLLLPGCTQSPQLAVQFTAAPPGSCAAPSAAWIQGRVECVHVIVHESGNPNNRAQIALPQAASNDRALPTDLVVSLGTETRFAFAVKRIASVTSYDIDVVAYGDTTAGVNPIIATGRATGVALTAGETVNLMLTPASSAGEWTCPGGEGSARVARAFHQAVAMPNGDVLLIGGIDAGVALTTSSPSAGLLTENVVQVFTPGSDTLQTVTIEGDASTFSRALFEARWVGHDGALERIRLFGGVTGTGRVVFELMGGTAGPVASVSEAACAQTWGRCTNEMLMMMQDPAPCDAARNACLAANPTPVVDVLYDPETRTIRAAETRAMYTTTAVETPIALYPGSPPAQGTPAAYGTSATGGRFAVIGGSVDVSTRIRRGATLSRFGPGWLIYGGNAADPAAMRDASTFSLLDAAGAPVAAMFPGDIVDTAFHTATAIDYTPTTPGDEAILYVGGIPLTGTDEAPFLIGTTPTPVRGVRRSGMAVEALSGAVTDPVAERAFHTATVVDSGRVIVVGGTTLMGGLRLQPTDTAFAVNVDVSGRMTQSSVDSLRTPRFGHAATLLSTGRLLVTGGLTRGVDSSARSVLTLAEEPEFLYVGSAPTSLVCGADLPDASMPDAPMMSVDAGLNDTGPSADANLDATSAPDANSDAR